MIVLDEHIPGLSDSNCHIPVFLHHGETAESGGSEIEFINSEI